MLASFTSGHHCLGQYVPENLLGDVLNVPRTSIAYEGIRVATMIQSSIAKWALLFHRARSLRHTATVSITPHAIATRFTASALDWTDMMRY